MIIIFKTINNVYGNSISVSQVTHTSNFVAIRQRYIRSHIHTYTHAYSLANTTTGSVASQHTTITSACYEHIVPDDAASCDSECEDDDKTNW